jgi:membrane-associated phospholipid phosphatase
MLYGELLSGYVPMKRKWLVLTFAIVAIFCALSFFYLDRPILRFCWSNLSGIKPTFEIITRFGYGTWYFVGLAILIVYFKFIRSNSAYLVKCLFVLTSLALSGIANAIIKFAFGRFRPVQFIDQNLYGFNFFSTKYGSTSFPSGHANLISALMLSLYFLFPRFGYLWLAFAFLVMASRVVLGVHYLSDVVFASYLAIVVTFHIRSHYRARGWLE